MQSGEDSIGLSGRILVFFLYKYVQDFGLLSCYFLVIVGMQFRLEYQEEEQDGVVGIGRSEGGYRCVYGEGISIGVLVEVGRQEILRQFGYSVLDGSGLFFSYFLQFRGNKGVGEGGGLFWSGFQGILRFLFSYQICRFDFF